MGIWVYGYMDIWIWALEVWRYFYDWRVQLGRGPLPSPPDPPHQIICEGPPPRKLPPRFQWIHPPPTMDIWILDTLWGTHICSLQVSGIRYQVSTAYTLLIHCVFAGHSGPPTVYSLLLRGHRLLIHCFSIVYSLLIQLIHCSFTAYLVILVTDSSSTACSLLIQCWFAVFSNTLLPKRASTVGYFK